MTFGYNADAAYAHTTDHAKSLLSSVVDRREKDDVGYQSLEYSLGPGDIMAKLLPRSCADLLYLLGIRLVES